MSSKYICLQPPKAKEIKTSTPSNRLPNLIIEMSRTLFSPSTLLLE